MVKIGFSTSNWWVSRLIRKYTKSEFSHCWIRYQHPYFKNGQVITAEFLGLTEFSIDTARRKWTNIVELTPPDGVDLTESLEVIGPTLGMGYDYGSLVGRAIKTMVAWVGFKIKNPLRNMKKDVCVDNVYRIIQAGTDNLDSVDPEEETPQSLYDRLISLGWIAVKDENSHT